jgi:hypothetical protein
MTQNCQKCNCPINWDKLIDKTFKKKDGSQGHGWWREDLSKEEHTKERCEQLAKSWEFVPKQNEIAQRETEKTVWPNSPTDYTPDQTNLMDAEQIYCKMAFDLVKSMHPTMDENSNTFGQIVNAKEGHLIQLAKVKAIRDLEITQKEAQK